MVGKEENLWEKKRKINEGDQATPFDPGIHADSYSVVTGGMIHEGVGWLSPAGFAGGPWPPPLGRRLVNPQRVHRARGRRAAHDFISAESRRSAAWRAVLTMPCNYGSPE